MGDGGGGDGGSGDGGGDDGSGDGDGGGGGSGSGSGSGGGGSGEGSGGGTSGSSDSSGSTPSGDAPSSPESSATPTPVPLPDDDGAAYGSPEVPTIAPGSSADQSVLTDGQSGAAQLESPPEPYAPPAPSMIGPQQVDPYSNVPSAGGTLNPFVGSNVDPYTNLPANGSNAGGSNAKPYTGDPYGNPFIGFPNTASPGATPLAASPAPATSAPTNAKDSAGVPRIVPFEQIREQVSGVTPIDRTPIDGDDYLHYRVTLDGVTYEAYVNDMALPNHALIVPVPSPIARSVTSPVVTPLTQPGPVATATSMPPVPALATPPAPTLGTPPAPATAPIVPDYTTQTEWSFPKPDPRLMQPVNSIDTGNQPLNFVLNKVLMPWRNALAFYGNIPLATLIGIDDELKHSRFQMEYQAAQDMLPLEGAMGLTMEIGPALDYAAAWLSTSQQLRSLTAAPEIGTAVSSGISTATRTGPAALDATGVRLATATADFVPEFEGANTVVPRQLSLFDIRPAMRGAGQTGSAQSAQWNRLMAFLYDFEPQAGTTYNLGGVSYSFDLDRRLVKVSTDKVVRGVRWDYVNRAYPQKIPGFDYGHVGGIEAFGTNDILLQTRGGFPQAAAMNRVGAWRVAEEASNGIVFRLQSLGLEFNKVAEVRNFVNGVPSEWRLYVESAGSLVFDSGWLKANLP